MIKLQNELSLERQINNDLRIKFVEVNKKLKGVNDKISGIYRRLKSIEEIQKNYEILRARVALINKEVFNEKE